MIKVIDFQGEPMVEREMVLVRIDSNHSNRHEIVGLGNIFGAKVAAVAPSSITFEMMGTRSMISDFINMVKPYGIKEIVRSGTIAIGQSRK